MLWRYVELMDVVELWIDKAFFFNWNNVFNWQQICKVCLYVSQKLICRQKLLQDVPQVNLSSIFTPTSFLLYCHVIGRKRCRIILWISFRNNYNLKNFIGLIIIWFNIRQSIAANAILTLKFPLETQHLWKIHTMYCHLHSYVRRSS